MKSVARKNRDWSKRDAKLGSIVGINVRDAWSAPVVVTRVSPRDRSRDRVAHAASIASIPRQMSASTGGGNDLQLYYFRPRKVTRV